MQKVVSALFAIARDCGKLYSCPVLQDEVKYKVDGVSVRCVMSK